MTPRLPVLAIAALSLVAAACASPERPAPQRALRMGVLTSTDYLPFYVMQDRGFASEQGLRITEVAFDSGTEIVAALVDGRIDVGQVGVPPLLAAAEAGTVPATVVSFAAGAFVSPAHPLMAVVAGPATEDWGDLAGQTVAVNAPVSLGAAALTGRMAVEGAAAPTLVNLPFANMGVAVRTGAVAAAVMLEPYLTQSLLREDGHSLGWVVGGAPLPAGEISLLVTRSALMQDRPRLLKAYLRANVAALEWLATHEAAARELLARRLVLTPAVARRVELPLFAPDARNDRGQLQQVVDAVQQPASSPGEVSRLFDDTLLGDVLGER